MLLLADSRTLLLVVVHPNLRAYMPERRPTTKHNKEVAYKRTARSGISRALTVHRALLWREVYEPDNKNGGLTSFEGPT
ncbi:hypothetical protein PLICRDRAFT_46341 [Plicaturopsis crispa FD-325 SS-3]|uniref:Uncharacterized protein n=1 Tax=Plicaturopsis crispa FD-325 SS-3 TaxID=944288 RepID=A0A0C9SXJ7_PLICR|nr:hypothetical protein PLICRDRAFT_46341 [Plicaturopsis crispa FD-325 SS-3]